ncbi:hypothetical protein BC940DRAFT_320649 [Gongronella butleri]|nr:hypothetical protein BC940DRAFT_320649 [Gongronella butleri]
MKILRKNTGPAGRPLWVELPVELVNHVLSLLPRQELAHWRLCCHAWSEIIWPLVFDKLVLRLDGSKRTMGRHPKDDALNAFRSVWVNPSTAADRAMYERFASLVRDVDVYDERFTLTDVTAVLMRCPHVTSLTLGKGVCLNTDWQIIGPNSGLDQEVRLMRIEREHWVDLRHNIGAHLAEPLARLFQTRDLTRLKLYGPLSYPIFSHLVMPYLGSLRELDLLSTHDDSYLSACDGVELDWGSLEDLQHYCPGLRKLAFVQEWRTYTPSYIKIPGSRHIETSIDTDMEPWSSIISLKICAVHNVSETLAVLCVKFPNLEALEIIRDASKHRHLRPEPSEETWKHYLDWWPPVEPNGYLPRLSSLKLHHLPDMTPLEMLHYYTTPSSPFIDKTRCALVSLAFVSCVTHGMFEIDIVRALEMFPSLRHIDFDQLRDLEPNDMTGLSMSVTRHPLRSLVLACFNDSTTLARLSEVCRHLTSVTVNLDRKSVLIDMHLPPASELPLEITLPSGKIRKINPKIIPEQKKHDDKLPHREMFTMVAQWQHRLPMIAWLPDNVLHLNPVQKIIRAQLRRNIRYINWIALPYSAALETLHLSSVGKRASMRLFILIQTPLCGGREPTSDAHVTTHGWFSTNGLEGARAYMDSFDKLHPLGLDFLDALLDQLDSDEIPENAPSDSNLWVHSPNEWSKATMIHSACSSARSKGIAVILTPTLPKDFTIFSQKALF